MNEILRLDWQVVKTEAQSRLEDLRKRNDSTELDASDTATLRGEIRALKWLLDLPKAVALKSQTPPPFHGGE